MLLGRRQVLLAGLATGASACASPRPTGDPGEKAIDICHDGALSILTWNIFMMPEWVRESPRNEPRARAIGATLLDQSFDILCLEKAFDPAARDVLEGILGAAYPYRYGPANDRGGIKICSGVWVLSRMPLAGYQEMQFDDCSGIECFSRKGAILLSGLCGAAPFRLIATHLQGEEGPRFTEKNARVRHRQMFAIEDQLITPHLKPKVPFLICGDMGTPRFTDDGQGETAAYKEMLATFGAENGKEPRITLDESREGNTLVKDGSGRKNELDYVLLRANGANMTVTRQLRVFQRGGWDEPTDERVDLSYRYAVAATVRFGG